jgi:hypothetical protein
MNFLTGLQNFLNIINDNWTTILVCAGLIVGIVKKTQDYLSKSDDEKIKIAKAQIKQVILKKISDAEVDYEEWNKAGSIKRSQVISEIYKEYPILSKVVDQTELIEWIDSEIDVTLKTLRSIIKENE